MPMTNYGHYIVVGFPVSVSTNEVKFWSTTRLSFYDSLAVSYSYDASFYFDATVSSVVEYFDNTIQTREGESPAIGEYRYTITLSSSYTARYFKIHAHHSTLTTTSTSDGGVDLTVASTTGFPDLWTDFTGTPLRVYGTTDTGHRSFGFIYTSKTATKFENITTDAVDWGAGGESLNIGSVVYCRFSFAEYVTEVEIVDNPTPMLEVWDTDGSQAASQDLDRTYYYDITYDSSNGYYYTIRYNNDLDGTAGTGFTLSDDFDAVTLSTTRWNESTVYSNFFHNASAGTLEYFNTANLGEITTRYYMASDFTASIDISFTDAASTGAFFKLETVDKDSNNVYVSMGFNGPFTLLPLTSTWEASQIIITTDTTGGTAEVRNIKLDTTSLSAGSETYTLVYDSTNDYWTVAVGSGGTLANITPGVDWAAAPFVGMNIVHLNTVPNGAQFVLSLNIQRTALPAYGTQTAWKVGIDRTGTSIVCKYDPGVGSFTNLVTYSDALVSDLHLVLFADGNDDSFDLSLDNFTVTGTGSFDNIPVFSVEAVNSTGVTTQVVGLTDASGYLIKRLDLINSEADFNEFVSGKVQITNDSQVSGNIFIKINGDVYKYAKSALPLDLEDGSLAAISKENVIPETTAKAFSYNGYSKAGLCYVEYDDDLDGTYIRTMGVSTVSGTDYAAPLDLSSSSYPFAWDCNNNTVFYYVDGTALKFFDVDEHDVSFCNVVSAEKIMSASSAETSLVTAVVLNAYGDPLSSKTVTFSVSAGDGSLSPATGCTTASGTASSTYTVGDTVGVSTITATASDISC